MNQFLPDPFIKDMKALLGAEMYPAFLASYERPVFSGIRINRLKAPDLKLPGGEDFTKEPVPWTDNGFYCENMSEMSHHPWHYAGLYYMQEPSAMTPASLLPIEEGDLVLDLCAAPGGKATELGARLSNSGFLLANDISATRARALLFNLERFGISHMAVCSETPEKLRGLFPAYFDKILIDAPCSGEGMFHKEPQMVRFYEEHGPAYYSEIQRELILQAADMLKPGGQMLFSTCTFSPQENEGTLAFLLKERPEFKLLAVPRYEGFSEGKAPFSDAVRIFPHLMKGEGHFAALLQKGDAKENKKDCAKDERTPLKDSTFDKLPKEAVSFLDSLLTADCFKGEGSFVMKNEQLFFIPKQNITDKKIRFLRTGLLLGEAKKNRFEPSQALAMVLTKKDVPLTLDLSSKDQRVIRYLKGETLEAPEIAGDKGFVLILVDGHPLGWGKADRGRIKNKYQASWRMK